jgi:acylpyruvate hydrolase
MRLVTFDKDGAPTVGVRVGDDIVDLSVAAPDQPQDLLGLLQAGSGAFDAALKAAEAAPASARQPYEGLTFHPLMRNAPKMFCLGLNYADHAAEGGHNVPVFPTLFMRGGTSLVGHNQPIVRPRLSETLDYECELAAFIGKRVKNMPEEDALDAVAGYACFNDGSVREYQRMTPQWTAGKNFDNTGGFGPDFVSADELPPGAVGLNIQTRLNGQVMQNANTEIMIFPVAKTIALVSELITLEPGDVLIMGTPSGVGHARTPPVWMKDGDVCEVEIEKIGILRNPIIEEA